MLPVCGSAYTYTYATLGELVAWIIGWDLILEYAMGAATVAVGWSGYVVSLLRELRHHHAPRADAGTRRRRFGATARWSRASSTCRPR